MHRPPQNKRFEIAGRAKRFMLWTALLLSVPALLAPFVNDVERGEWERRALAEPPPVSEIVDPRSYFASWDAWINDHIALFMGFNQVYRRALYQVLGDNPAPHVSATKGEAIFMNGFVAARQNMLVEAACSDGSRPVVSAESLAAMQCITDFFAYRGSRTIFGFAPLKTVIYPELLPDTIPQRLRDQCLSFPVQGSLASELADQERYAGLQVHFPLSAFRAARDGPYFYPLDNFHWSGDSAFLFASGMLSRLDTLGLDRITHQRELRDLESDFSYVGFPIVSRQWQYRYPEQPVRRTELALGRESPVRAAAIYQTDQTVSGQQGVLLTDSFGAGLIEHLAPAFRSLSHVYYTNLEVDEYQPLVEFLAALQPGTEVLLVHQHGVLPRIERTRRLARALAAHDSTRGAGQSQACSRILE
jgi:hypothetical protein